MITKFECEKCGAIGTVPHAPDVGVCELLVKIHELHALLSMGCEFDAWKVRVRLIHEKLPPQTARAG